MPLPLSQQPGDPESLDPPNPEETAGDRSLSSPVPMGAGAEPGSASGLSANGPATTGTPAQPYHELRPRLQDVAGEVEEKTDRPE